jgi:cytochrome c6
MKKSLIAIWMLLVICLSATTGLCATKNGEKINGKKKYEEHCKVCHPNGGNIINSQKPLTGKSLKAHGLISAKDIIGKMRNPGPGMTTFDEKTIPNKEAEAITEYILKTFK